MKQRHPDLSTLERFALGELSPGESLRIERHLESCPECEWQVDELAAEDEILDGLLAPFDPGDYDQAVDRVLTNARGWMPDLFREVDSSAALFAELLGGSPRERWGRVLEEECFHTVKLCQLLMDHSRDSWFTAPSAALDRAGLAVGIARSLDASRYGRGLVEDVRARAWAYLGNAYRILADYARAEAALEQALRHLELSGDPVVRGEVLGLMGSLSNSQRRHEEALRYHDWALAAYREVEDQRSEAGLLISKGAVFVDAGRPEEALRVLREGLSKIQHEDEPLLWLGVQHNLIWALGDMGRYEAAWKALKRAEWAYRETGGSALLRGRWGEALIISRLGRLDETESLLLDVRESFAELRVTAEAAQVSLDLALVYARQGRRSDCRRTAAEVIPILEALDFQEKALAARLLYERAGGG